MATLLRADMSGLLFLRDTIAPINLGMQRYYGYRNHGSHDVFTASDWYLVYNATRHYRKTTRILLYYSDSEFFYIPKVIPGYDASVIVLLVCLFSFP